MTEKRDARGTLRDYEKRSEWELLPVFFGLFQGLEIFSMAFSPASLFEPDSDSPWGCLSSFDIANATQPTLSVSTTKEGGIMCIAFWRNKSKIGLAIVEPVSVYVVYKSPAVFWLADNMIMHKIITKPGVTIIAFVEFDSEKLLIVNILIDDSMADKFMLHVVQWGLYDFSINNGVMEDSFLVYWWDKVFIPSFHSPIMKLAEPFCEVRAVAPWNFTYHNNIISKNYKVSRRNNG